jgi:nucleoside-triphosphatase THEP1
MDNTIDRHCKSNVSLPERECAPTDNAPATGNRVILVSGEKHCGKTTLVERYLASLVGRDLRIGGILAKGLWEDNARAGFDLVNLSDGSIAPLARRRHHPHPQHKMMFDFLEAGIRAGAQALDAKSCGQSDIVVVDELGRLEARGKGWAPDLKALLAFNTPLFIFIVRLDCLQRICDRFGFYNPPVIDARNPHALDHLRAVAERVWTSG